jgi:hypothetical protein
MLQWLRRRQEARRLAQADAEALIRDHGAGAYSEARQRQRDVVLPDGTTHAGPTRSHWQRVALIVAGMTGKRIGLIRRPGCSKATNDRATGGGHKQKDRREAVLLTSKLCLPAISRRSRRTSVRIDSPRKPVRQSRAPSLSRSTFRERW